MFYYLVELKVWLSYSTATSGPRRNPLLSDIQDPQLVMTLASPFRDSGRTEKRHIDLNNISSSIRVYKRRVSHEGQAMATTTYIANISQELFRTGPLLPAVFAVFYPIISDASEGCLDQASDRIYQAAFILQSIKGGAFQSLAEQVSWYVNMTIQPEEKD